MQHAGKGLLLDPGGLEISPEVIAAISKYLEVDSLEGIFSSHQDPDIISSLSLWLELNPRLNVYVSWVWGKFIPHFGGAREVTPIPDGGMEIPLGGSTDLRAVPAHYLHSSGNFTLYDPRAKILFSADIGAALMPDADAPMLVADFDKHIGYMDAFHRRWMPSNRAKNDWLDRVSQLDIDFMCPQHGSVFPREHVPRFFEWFRGLQVGNAIG